MRRLRKKEGQVTVFLAIILLDQLTKLGRGFLNQGSSWGIFTFLPLPIIFFAFIILLWLLSRRCLTIPFALIFSGGLSNLIDRIIRGGVVDWISLSGLPAFNLADIAITLGLILILVDSFALKSVR